MRKLVISIIIFLSSVLFSSGMLQSQSFDNIDEKMILRAMQDEIDRSLSDLKLESLMRPYYVAYSIEFQDVFQVRSSLGGVVQSGYTRYARLTVQVRVGNYTFDNSNFFDVGLSFFGSSDDEEGFINRQIPVELDYETLRKELWLATDAAYKAASEIYSKKEAVLKNLLRKDTTPDYTRVPAAKSRIYDEYKSFDIKKYETLLNDISSIFLKYPRIYSSTVGVEYMPELKIYLNSEGMQYVKTDFFTGFEAVAFTQAEDGMPLIDHYAAYANYPQELPSTDSLKSGVRDIADHIDAMLDADYLEDTYVGPVMFRDQAAAELFAQIYAPNLVAQRKQLSEGGFSTGESSRSFQRKIGGRVLPEFLSLHAIDNRESYKGVKLAGHFKLDDEGIAPQDTTLVENGYLRALLSDRTPIKRVMESNGHSRGGGPMYGNLLLTATKEKTVSQDSLKSRLIELCKARELPYGIIIEEVLNQNILMTTVFSLTLGNFRPPQGEGKFLTLVAKKIYPDGREEMVRGAVGAGFSVQSFRDILLLSDDDYVHNLLATSVIMPFMSGGDQFKAASLIVPDLLFEDAEIRLFEQDFNKPVILQSPLGSIRKYGK